MSEPPEDVAIQAALEEQLDALPLVKHQYSLVTPEDHVPADDQDIGWYYTRPAATSPGPHSLMASTFRRPGMIAIPPLAFAKNDDSEAVLFYHLGDGLSGHKGIVHGGVIATLMDDSLARNAFLSLPSKTGVTASLNVDYLKPTKTDQFIVVRSRLESLVGRKATVTGTIEDLEGNVLARATGLFIEPRNVTHVLSDSGLGAVWGERSRPASGSTTPALA